MMCCKILEEELNKADDNATWAGTRQGHV